LFLAPGEGDTPGDSVNNGGANGNDAEGEAADNESNISRAARILRGQT
jgi:hypothetical protein